MPQTTRRERHVQRRDGAPALSLRSRHGGTGDGAGSGCLTPLRGIIDPSTGATVLKSRPGSPTPLNAPARPAGFSDSRTEPFPLPAASPALATLVYARKPAWREPGKGFFQLSKPTPTACAAATDERLPRRGRELLERGRRSHTRPPQNTPGSGGENPALMSWHSFNLPPCKSLRGVLHPTEGKKTNPKSSSG